MVLLNLSELHPLEASRMVFHRLDDLLLFRGDLTCLPFSLGLKRALV